MSNTEQSDEFGLSVVTAHPTLRERQLALAAAGTILVGLAAIAPFADISVVRLDSFIPSIQVIVSITSTISAVLLFGQFWTLRLLAPLVLASGYLFVALIVISHTLTFPGAFSPTGLLGAGSQTAAWLYFFWHFGFPVAVIGFVLVKGKVSVRYSAASMILWTVGTTVGLACVLTWIVTAKEQLLPVLFIEGGRYSRFAPYVTGADLFLSALALALLWKRSRSILDLWLCVTLCAFLSELVIATVIISGRFTLGWYSGRAFSVLVPTIVLIVMLAQTFALNAKLMHLTRLLQRERSNKLANIDAVVASIAHEVRQPLAGIAIRGAAAKRYLNRAPPSLREVGSCIDTMVDASMRANEIFENIRTLFSSANQPREPVDLNQLTVEALGLLREELDAYQIEISIEQTPHLPSIMAHKGQLREVILNLIQNAIDAMKPISDRRRVLRIGTGRDDNKTVFVSVEDTGPGIQTEKINSIFDPFFSTKIKGMGLGLAICKSIVERHHGQLSVSSKIGRGARFNLILPIQPMAQHELPGELVESPSIYPHNPSKSAYS